MWKIDEIQQYKIRDYQPLVDLYDKAGLGDALPEKRAKYLSENVLKLTKLDHEVIMMTAYNEGRPASLNLLEDMVIALHKKKIEQGKKEIILPLNN